MEERFFDTQELEEFFDPGNCYEDDNRPPPALCCPLAFRIALGNPDGLPRNLNDKIGVNTARIVRDSDNGSSMKGSKLL
jgi:hypothetical protein